MAAAAAAVILASGVERDLQYIVEDQATAIGFLFWQNNFAQEAVFRETIVDLISKNNEERHATHEEFDKKLNEVKSAVLAVNDAQTQADASRNSQEDFFWQGFEKAQKLLTDLADMDLKMSSLNTDLVESTTRSRAEL